MTHELVVETGSRGVPAPGAERETRAAHAILDEVFGPPEDRAFAVRLWDGSVVRPVGTSRYTLVLSGPSSLRRMFLPPSELRMAQAYLREDFDIEGDLEAATELADIAAARLRSTARLARLLARLLTLPPGGPPLLPGLSQAAFRGQGRLHSRRRDERAVRFHYDLGNEFFALWLDRRMVYSCAYFPGGDEDLDVAQEAKLEYICRKLRLRPGERLLDVGCGWGSLLIHAAERYGVEALGITLSEPQAELARTRVSEAGLAGRCRVEVRDYRDLPDEPGFDKAVSVGMVEHVGRSRLAEYFRKIFGALVPGGLFLNHGIVASRARLRPGFPSTRPGRTFIDRHVFPDGDIEPLDEVLRAAEPAGFEVRDLENLREHYARTLRLWMQRLQRRHAEAADLVGEAAYRVWRLYMAGSARAFATGRLGVIQTLLARPDAAGLARVPPTRADVYAGARTGEPQTD
jgi:cyclopropane-fatty-acyl-phospholipid synthase